MEFSGVHFDFPELSFDTRMHQIIPLHCGCFFLDSSTDQANAQLGSAPSSSGFSWVGQASRHLSLSSRQESQLALLSCCSQPGVYDLSSIRVSAIPADLTKTKKSVLQQRPVTVSANCHHFLESAPSLMSGPRCIKLVLQQRLSLCLLTVTTS